jgi:Recombination endonuclease VII
MTEPLPYHLGPLSVTEARALTPEQKRERVKHQKRAEYQRSRAANPERYREKGRRSRAANPEKQSRYSRRWKTANPEKSSETYRRHDLKRKYDITLSDYTFLSATQSDVCAVCHRPCNTGRRLAVDHCHETKLVRGLLCFDCNASAGKLGEDPDRIERLAAYIRAHNTKAAKMIGFTIPTSTAPNTTGTAVTEGSSK